MISDRTIITPDFARYDWKPLEGVVLDDANFVTTSWADGVTLKAYSLWLAENTAGLGLDPTTRESTIDPSDLPPADSLIRALKTREGALELRWKIDGADLVTHAHPGWLHHVATTQLMPTVGLTSTQIWTANELGEPPTIDGTDILTSSDGPRRLAEWLQLMLRFGIGRLRNVPVSEDFLEVLAGAIGPIRRTNFGAVFSVRSVPNPTAEQNSTANTGLNLGQHSDLPTRETPPGYQFLHCIANDAVGGYSRMTDGWALVEHLRTSHPEDYEALTTLNWSFVNRSPDADHRWCGPIIDHGGPGQPLTLRAFYPVRAFPAMEPRDVASGYRALRTFSRLAHHDDYQMRYPFKAGDLVGFDNRRVLHGRDSFDPNSGLRHLRGCYIDHDELYSRLRVLRRAAAPL